MVKWIAVAFFCAIGFVEMYCYFNGYFVAGVLLDILNSYIDACYVENKRLY